MSKRVDDMFAAIINHALERAGGIACSGEEYREQLKNWRYAIEASIAASEALEGFSKWDAEKAT